MSGRTKLARQRAEARKDDFRKVGVLLDENRRDFQAMLLHETAQMAESWNPSHRFVAREILGINDHKGVERFELDRETRARMRSMKKVFAGHTPTLDKFAKEILKDKDVENEELKNVAAKLVNARFVQLIKKHVNNPDSRRPKESELVEAIENLDVRVAAPMREELKKIVQDSPHESVKRAAMALLSRVYR